MPFARSNRVRYPGVLAANARLRGDEADAEHRLRQAHRLYTAMGATGHAERLAGELGLAG